MYFRCRSRHNLPLVPGATDLNEPPDRLGSGEDGEVAFLRLVEDADLVVEVGAHLGSAQRLLDRESVGGIKVER